MLWTGQYFYKEFGLRILEMEKQCREQCDHGSAALAKAMFHGRVPPSVLRAAVSDGDIAAA